MSQEVLIRAEGGVLTITISRLERKNSITAALAVADADRAVRAVVLEGHESVFTAGNDLGDFLKNPGDGEQSPAFKFMHALANFPKPLIAASRQRVNELIMKPERRGEIRRFQQDIDILHSSSR